MVRGRVGRGRGLLMGFWGVRRCVLEGEYKGLYMGIKGFGIGVYGFRDFLGLEWGFLKEFWFNNGLSIKIWQTIFKILEKTLYFGFILFLILAIKCLLVCLIDSFIEKFRTLFLKWLIYFL